MDRAVFGTIAIFSGRIPRTNFLDDWPKTRDLSKVIFPNISDSTVSIAGKTGTTEKYIVGSGYAPGKYISSFASIFPYESPKYIMVVSIDEPDPNNYFGGDISAPIVANLAEHMLINGYIE